jgi:Sperm-tail PG-rich repeat
LTTIRQNPGPGTYEPKANVDKVGKCFISTIKNTGAPSFSLPSLPRFQHEKNENVPGPGAYSLKIGISDPAHQFMSSFRSPKTRTFYHSDRKTIDIPNDARSKNYSANH